MQGLFLASEAAPMSLADAPLGHTVAYPNQYDPSLLFPLPRATNRDALAWASLAGAAGSAVPHPLPFDGCDIWNAYEVSWLNERGLPQVAMARFWFPATSPNIVESKSFKLYLNAFNNTRLSHADELHARLTHDLSHAAGAPVQVALILPADFHTLHMGEGIGIDIDDQDIEITGYSPDPDYLNADAAAPAVHESLRSRLLKSNCPVTGQPDWATVHIDYHGAPIDRAGLLRYVVSFRDHAEFHEHCVERMFVDIMARCRPHALTVYARYTRRGGLDINPWRSNTGAPPPADLRTARQ